MATHITINTQYAEALIAAFRDALDSGSDETQVTLTSDNGAAVEIFLRTDNNHNRE